MVANDISSDAFGDLVGGETHGGSDVSLLDDGVVIAEGDDAGLGRLE